jgi:hypothetical protein
MPDLGGSSAEQGDQRAGSGGRSEKVGQPVGPLAEFDRFHTRFVE